MINLFPQHAHDVRAGEALKFTDDIDKACNDIHDACDGFGTDEDKLNEVLAARSAADRYLIAARYPELFEKDLKDVIKSETSGNYGKLLQFISQPIDMTEAQILREATKGAGTEEKWLYPILCGRTTAEIDLLKKAFFKAYDEDLLVTLDDDVSGDLGKYFTTIMQELAEPFDESIHTDEKAEEFAENLYSAGEGKWGTDEMAFFRLFCTCPPELMEKVDRIYATKHGNTVGKAIKKEFGGKVEDAFLFHYGMIIKPYDTIAELFESTMKGIGTDELGLAACMARYQHVLPEVKVAYEKQYGKSLRDRVHGETSGKFRQLLLMMLNAN